MLVCIQPIAVVTCAISTCCGHMEWCLAYQMLMHIPTVTTGQAYQSVLAAHDKLSTIYMDLALMHDAGLTVLPSCLAQHHAFPSMLPTAIVLSH